MGSANEGCRKIGNRNEGTAGREAPIQIGANVLRDRQSATACGTSGFALMTGDTDKAEPGRSEWRQEDVERAIAAAEQAGLRHYRVEIAPDGMISIIVDTPADAAATGL